MSQATHDSAAGATGGVGIQGAARSQVDLANTRGMDPEALRLPIKLKSSTGSKLSTILATLLAAVPAVVLALLVGGPAGLLVLVFVGFWFVPQWILLVKPLVRIDANGLTIDGTWQLGKVLSFREIDAYENRGANDGEIVTRDGTITSVPILMLRKRDRQRLRDVITHYALHDVFE